MNHILSDLLYMTDENGKVTAHRGVNPNWPETYAKDFSTLHKDPLSLDSFNIL